MSIEYRKASIKDVRALVDAAKALFLAHKHYGDMQFTPAVAAAHTLTHIRYEDCEVFVAMEGNHPVGAVFVELCDTIFGPGKIAIDQSFYVFPEYRELGVGEKLIEMAEEWCIKHGADRILFTVTSGLNPETTQTFFENRGYTYAGPNMIKAVKQPEAG
jgi:GNAT superfamily N-acetyltransferase